MCPTHIFMDEEEVFQSVSCHPERQVRIDATATLRPKEKLKLGLARGPFRQKARPHGRKA